MKPRQSRTAVLIATGVALAVVAALVVLADSPARSLLTFHQVDDYPLYVMQIYGDYGLDEFLKEGMNGAGERPPAEQGSGGRLACEAPQPRVLAPVGFGCSVFAAVNPDGDPLLGRNFDWHNRPTLLLFTHPSRGYDSASLVDLSYLGFTTKKPSWADRTRLLDAPYLPFDGMNERGLALGMMAVPSAQPSQDPQRVTIDSLQAIRLVLDKAWTVEQAIDLLQQYNIDFEGGPPLHYLVADRSGKSAVLEFLGGKMVVLQNQEPWQVATNFLLAGQSLEGAKSQCWRYARAYETLERAQGRLSQGEAMHLLQDVSQPITMWSVVYNLGSGEITVAMGRDYDQVHPFKLPMKSR